MRGKRDGNVSWDEFSGDVARFVTRFSWQSTARMSEKSGADARFPYEHRQIVVVGLIVFLLWEQEVPGSNPGAPTRDKRKPDKRLAESGFSIRARREWV
jgi:hypothetical protein